MTFNDITKKEQLKHPDVEGNYPNWKYTQELYNRIELIEECIECMLPYTISSLKDQAIDNLGQLKSFIEALQPLEDETTI